MEYLNIPKYERQRESKYCILRKKNYSQMATAFGICFTVFTQMEGDPTVKTTLPPFTVPIQNLLLLRV
jgi:hypothetical protein